MTFPQCSPPYTYRPKFLTGNAVCSALQTAEHRSRVMVTMDNSVDQLFIRSKGFGPDKNDIAVECTYDNLISKMFVYVRETIVEQYVVTLGAGGISQLRTQVNSNTSSIIEIPPLNYDIYDLRLMEYDGSGTPPDVGGLGTFLKQYFIGGSGLPTTARDIQAIRTGPERTLAIVLSTENSIGQSVISHSTSTNRVYQWNGSQWISYRNLVTGHCPANGT